MTAPTDRPLRVALTVLGCKVNFAEMADLAGHLAAAGCELVPEREPADVRVLNSCTVTNQADATTRQRIRRLRRIAAHVLGLSEHRAAAATGGSAAMRARAFIKVQDGCDHRCTYCIVWRARGASSSVPPDVVMDRVVAAVAGRPRG